jgi:hypothetical protein
MVVFIAFMLYSEVPGGLEAYHTYDEYPYYR